MDTAYSTTLTEDQRQLMRLAYQAQHGNRTAAEQLTPLIARLAGQEREMQRPQAFTAQSIAIDATMRRCHNCGADHRTWQCPEIGDALFAPEPRERQCPECHGEGDFPNYACLGDSAGGYADRCQLCHGTGKVVAA